MTQQKKRRKKNKVHQAVPLTEEQHRTGQHKRAVLEALKLSLGIVTTACEKAEVSRSQFYVWMKEDEAFAEEVKDVGEIAIDYVESKLLKSVTNGNVTAQIFFLKTKGKNRGYVERTEHTGANGAPLVRDPYDTMTEDELHAELRRLDDIEGIKDEIPADS